MENRVKYIFESRRRNTIIDRIVSLRDAIAQKEELILNIDELNLLKDRLKKEKDVNILRRLWNLACYSEYNQELFDYSKNKLNDNKYLRRDYALAYIGNQKPELLSWLKENYRNDSDPYVVFELAHLMIETDPDEAVNAMIDIWLKVDSFDHETTDSIGMVVRKYGNRSHLEKIRKIRSEDIEHESYWNQWMQYFENK